MYYHINNKENKEECFARKRACRFGGPLVSVNANTVNILPNQTLSYDQSDELFDEAAFASANWMKPSGNFWNAYKFNNRTWDNFQKQVPGILSQLSRHFPKDPDFKKCHPFGDFKDRGKQDAEDFYDDWTNTLNRTMYSEILQKDIKVFDAIYYESCLYQKEILKSIQISEQEYRKVLSVYFARMAKGFSMEGVARNKINKKLKDAGNHSISVVEAPSVLEKDDIDAVIKNNGVVIGYISIKCFGAISPQSRQMWREKSHKKKQLDSGRKIPHFFLGFQDTRKDSELLIFGHRKDEKMDIQKFLQACEWLKTHKNA